jgi:ketosteroid isomerase-like protein
VHRERYCRETPNWIAWHRFRGRLLLPYSGPTGSTERFSRFGGSVRHSTERHDAAIATEYYDDSVFVVSPQGRQPVIGRDANREAWARLFRGGNPTHSMTVDVAAASGDLAFSRGRWTVGVDTPQGRSEAAGVYLSVWRRRSGRWRIIELSAFTTR